MDGKNYFTAGIIFALTSFVLSVFFALGGTPPFGLVTLNGVGTVCFRNAGKKNCSCKAKTGYLISLVSTAMIFITGSIILILR